MVIQCSLFPLPRVLLSITGKANILLPSFRVHTLGKGLTTEFKEKYENDMTEMEESIGEREMHLSARKESILGNRTLLSIIISISLCM